MSFSDSEIFQVRTHASGPAGALPLTPEMLAESPSGDLFGLSQNVGMGWEAALAAGPQFAQLTMLPQPLELNVIGEGAAQWWETMDRRPIVRKMFILFLLALIGGTLWFIFRM